MISRQAAMALLLAQNPEPHLVNHAVQTEAVMGALAGHLGLDRELWAITGLLHDVDFPQTKADPARHGLVAQELLAGALPGQALRAIAAHNGECTGVAPESPFDFALRCGETVTGMVSAAALVRPTRMEGMTPKSLKKKMKDKAFAAAVRRENILECDKAGIPLDTFLTLAIAAMTAVAGETGLA